MKTDISCKDLGMDCEFMASGESEDEILDALMHHVHAVHGEDWFEIEEIYTTACSVLRKKVA